MATLITRTSFRPLALIGVTAGLIFLGFEIIGTTLLTGVATAGMPIRMAGAIVLGRVALDPHYSFVAAGAAGVIVHLLLSVVFACAFDAIVTGLATATEGVLLGTSAQLALAGIVFGTVVWLVDFYVVARLSGWSWFPDNTHHIVAFLGHAFFFGGPLGWMYGRSADIHADRI
jgi:hypothetical protein